MTDNSSGSTLTLTLPTDREIAMTRAFKAPRELVFRACTDPRAIPRWWGPRNLTTRVEEMEVRPGGAWRFVQRSAEGEEFAFRGVYREIEAPERLVYTFEFEGMPGHVALETVVFEDRGDGTTLMRDTLLFDSVEDRDGMIASGMESGARESMDRLAEHLGRNPALDGLDVLIGEWEMRSPQYPEGRGRVTFERTEGGAFLVERSIAQEGTFPSSTWVIGRDDSGDGYTALYADDRGVSRIYQMTLTGSTWTIQRLVPGFNQRFTATIAPDASTMTGAWEFSKDGTTWSKDFSLDYTRLR